MNMQQHIFAKIGLIFFKKMPESSAIVSKVWNYAHILKKAGPVTATMSSRTTCLFFGFSLRIPGFAPPGGSVSQ